LLIDCGLLKNSAVAFDPNTIIDGMFEFSSAHILGVIKPKKTSKKNVEIQGFELTSIGSEIFRVIMKATLENAASVILDEGNFVTNLNEFDGDMYFLLCLETLKVSMKNLEIVAYKIKQPYDYNDSDNRTVLKDNLLSRSNLTELIKAYH